MTDITLNKGPSVTTTCLSVRSTRHFNFSESVISLICKHSNVKASRVLLSIPIRFGVNEAEKTGLLT